MKKILFICSHPYSGSSALYEGLNQHQKIQGFKSSNFQSYSSPNHLLDLTNYPHKLTNRSAIYMDELLYNQSFYLKYAYSKCKFVYVIREPEIPLNFMIAQEKKKPIFAVRQYTFRLRRICEMAKRTAGAVVLTWDDLRNEKGMDILQEYLGITGLYFNSELLLPYKRSFNNAIKLDLLEQTQDCYEKYLYFLKQQNLLFVK